MVEIPEGYVLAKQINETLTGKRIQSVIANHSPHAFAWYSGDPALYDEILRGKTLKGANDGSAHTCGGNVEIEADDMLLVISTPIRYHEPGGSLPKKHQLLVEFDDRSAITCTVRMWGAMLCCRKDLSGIPDGYQIRKAPSPLTNEFSENYFCSLLTGCPGKYSLKAFLATEQRIPGFGNGVLHDVLFHAGLHPKKKIDTLTDKQKDALFHAVKDTLLDMAKKAAGTRKKTSSETKADTKLY